MTCPSCDGTGRWLIEDTETLMDCTTCGGSGEAKPIQWDAHEEFKESADFARKALRYVCGDLSNHRPTVRKHEATNHEHLRRIYERAAVDFPEFADTLAWMLWHRILDFDRLKALTEMYPFPSVSASRGESGEAGAWDREAAMRVAERLGALYHAHDPNSPNAFLLDDAAALLRAAAAEIARLRAREEAAEKVAEAAREAAQTFAWCREDEADRGLAPAADAMMDLNDALAAWDASRGEGGR